MIDNSKMTDEKVAYNLENQNTPLQAAISTHYVYSSLPTPLPQDLKGRRPRYQNNVPKPQGVHHFYNMMWDPRVRRGVTYPTPADHRDAEGERHRKTLMASLPPRDLIPWDTYSPEKKKEIKAERHLPAQLRAKRHMALQIELANQLAEASRLRKRNRAKRRKEREEALERLDQIQKQKRLLTKRNSEGWHDELNNAEEEAVQVKEHLKELDAKEEEYLRKLSLVSADSDVELRDDEPSLVELQLDDRPSDDSQDEDEVPRQPKWIFPAVPSLDPSMYSEKAIQTLPGDFFTLTDEILGVMGHMVATSVKEAISELCIEEEEHTMKLHQEEFNQKRLEHMEHMKKLQARTQLVANERERLKAAAEEEERLKEEGKRIVRRAMFSSNASGDMVKDTVNRLETEGFFGDLYLHRVSAEFVPWVMSAVKLYVRDEIIARAIMDELIQEVVAMRDDELQYANYKQGRTTESGTFYEQTKESEAIIDADDNNLF